MNEKIWFCLFLAFLSAPACKRQIAGPPAPEPRDPYAGLKVAANPDYRELTVALMLTENTRKSMARGREGGAKTGFDVNLVHEQDIEMYRRNFKAVVAIDSLAEGRSVGADLVIAIDRIVTAGFRFEVESSLGLFDPEGREIDEIHARSDSGSARPSEGGGLASAVYAITDDLRNRMEAGLRASEKLRAYARSRVAQVRAASVPTGPAVRPADRSPTIVAVFGIQDASRKLDDDVLAQLTTYLGTQLAKSGTFKVIPMDQIRSRLVDEKAGTFRTCYDESCQIELGKALSAQKSLATTLIQVGSSCAVTANLFDLKTETTEKGASVETGCLPDELLKAMRDIAEQLSR